MAFVGHSLPASIERPTGPSKEHDRNSVCDTIQALDSDAHVRARDRRCCTRALHAYVTGGCDSVSDGNVRRLVSMVLPRLLRFQQPPYWAPPLARLGTLNHDLKFSKIDILPMEWPAH